MASTGFFLLNINTDVILGIKTPALATSWPVFIGTQCLPHFSPSPLLQHSLSPLRPVCAHFLRPHQRPTQPLTDITARGKDYYSAQRRDGCPSTYNLLRALYSKLIYSRRLRTEHRRRPSSLRVDTALIVLGCSCTGHTETNSCCL